MSHTVTERPSFPAETRMTLVLALPLIAGQLGQMLMGVVDTVMIGRLGVVELGAATFANTLLIVPLVIGMGLLTAVSVRVSQAFGAGLRAEAEEALRHGTWLALALGIVTTVVTLAVLPWLSHWGQPAEVSARTPGYLLLCALSITPALLATAWKNHADALHHPWVPFFITLGGVALNALLNWLLIWGHAGLPALGLEGAGVATLLARLLTALALLLWLQRSRRLRRWVPVRWWQACRWQAFRHLLAIGGPASLHMLTEVGAFAATALLIGTLGTVPLAAHQIAIACASTAFMIPLGLSMAITVRIGRLHGAGEGARLRRVLAGGWLFALGVMSLSMLLFTVLGTGLAGLFVRDAAVVQLASSLLVVAGLFQLFDGIQIVSAGALRGVDDARVPAWTAFIAYWVIAVPVGVVLGLYAGWGAQGMWAGLAVGLAVAAVVLAARAWRLLAVPAA